MQLIVSNLHEANLAVAYFQGLEAQPARDTAEKPKAQKPSKESTESKEATIDDLRAAAVAYRDAHGKEALATLLEGRKLAELDVSEYRGLILALAL
jgi:hypothetical protein